MSAPDNRREVAVRIFASEYDQAEFEYAESDEERAPKYVVSPTGARINRLFTVGVLTAVEQVNENTIRARIADPTGVFVVYAGQYEPDALAFLQKTEPPAFVAITGKANTFQPDDSDDILTSVRPERINEVDAKTRDRWVIQTAEQTLTRIEQMATALALEKQGDELKMALQERSVPIEQAEGIVKAINYYNTTPDYLGAVKEQAIQTLEVVAGERDEIEAIEQVPSEKSGKYILDELQDITPERVDQTVEAESITESEIASGEVKQTSTPDEEETDNISSSAASEIETQEDGLESGPPSFEEGLAEENQDEGITVDEQSLDLDSSTEETEFDTVDSVDAESDPDELYTVDEEERERIESEHGLEFETGNDVPEPEETESKVDPDLDMNEEPIESDIDTTQSEEVTSTDSISEETMAAGQEESAVEPDDDESKEEIDIDTVLLDQMESMDGGAGASRSELIDIVTTETGASAEDVEDAIDEALMGGQCYEPEDGKLKRI